MPLYFAYGSNIDTGAMAVRCPRSTSVGLARLPRHRLALTRRGFATVQPDPRGVVWGLLWNLALSDVPALDRWEELARGLYLKTFLSVLRAGGSAVRSMIYIADRDLPGPQAPSDYGAAILHAADAAGFPASYTATLTSTFRKRGEP